MDIEVRVDSLRSEERAEAAGVAARGMRDNPIHVAAFGADPERRIRVLRGLFEALFAVSPTPPCVARRGGYVVGVAGAAPPGTCRPPLPDLARLLPSLLRAGPSTTRRTLAWFRAWAERDPTSPHWHLGPVSVEGGLQGLGIGSRLLARVARDLDARGETGWLETDKSENVRFYERFGFRVASEAAVLGVPCWFMERLPRDVPAPLSRA
jgi:ribosomal protein S18 acetylase RimI-like enzyme